MSKSKIIASVEARMGSSRFPGKMNADICGMPALGRVFQRLQRSKMLDGIVLATTDSPEDEALTNIAQSMGIPYFCGSEEDVLLRVVEANRSVNTDIIVEVTGDSTLLDPEVIDQGIKNYLINDIDVVCNVVKLTYPQGVDVQVFSLEKLEEVEAKVNDPEAREHVSLYFYEHPEQYRIFNFVAPESVSFPEYRFQLDYEEDYQFITSVYERLLPVKEDFGLNDIIDLINREPELIKINMHMEEEHASYRDNADD